MNIFDRKGKFQESSFQKGRLKVYSIVEVLFLIKVARRIRRGAAIMILSLFFIMISKDKISTNHFNEKVKNMGNNDTRHQELRKYYKFKAFASEQFSKN